MKKFKLVKLITTDTIYDSKQILTYLPSLKNEQINLINFNAAECFSKVGITNFIRLYKTESELTNELIEKLIDYKNAINSETGDILFSSDGEYFFAYLTKDKKFVYAFNDDSIDDKVIIESKKFYNLLLQIQNARKKLK